MVLLLVCITDVASLKFCRKAFLPGWSLSRFLFIFSRRMQACYAELVHTCSLQSHFEMHHSLRSSKRRCINHKQVVMHASDLISWGIHIVLQLSSSTNFSVQMSSRDWQLSQTHPNPIPTRRLKHRTYLWLHLSFDQYFFQQLSRSPQPPYQLHRQLYLNWPPPPVYQIHTQTAQANSPLITYPPAAVFFLCTCFSPLYL
jgi:hypothetical protein